MAALLGKKRRKRLAKGWARFVKAGTRTYGQWHPDMHGEIEARNRSAGVLYWLASAAEALLLPFHSLIALGVFGFAVVGSNQGQDVLVKAIEDAQQASSTGIVLVFALAVLLLALACWYAARMTYCSPAHTFIAFLDQHERIQSWWPRILGGVPFLLVAWGLLKVSRPLPWAAVPSASAPWAPVPWAALLPLAVAALVYAAFVIWRRAIPFLGLKPVEETHGRKLSPAGWAWIALSGAIAAVMIAAYGLRDPPEWVTLSPGAALACGLAVLTIFATLITLASRRTRLPCYALLVAWIAVAGYVPWTDNHAVRTDPAAQWPAGRQPVADALLERAGYAPRGNAGGNGGSTGSGNIVAFVVVAGQGGGIRAAYWTAGVLARMQCMGLTAGAGGAPLTRRVWATSTVSGSSLGSAVFSAWLHGDDAWRADACERSRDAIRGMLGGDFLAPAFASFLFPDLAQRIVPHPWFHDRAYVMELAWERQWAAVSGAGPEPRPAAALFAGPFPDVMSVPAALGGAPRALPVPFFNATEVESGRRLIVAPLAFDEDSFHCVFKAADQAARLLPRPVRLSTAALMSARFPYLTPAGRIPARQDAAADASLPPGQGCREGTNLTDDSGWMREVDGGYYDDSGAATAAEIVRALAGRLGPRARPVFIQIDNEPLKEAKPQAAQHKRLWLPETLSPPEAIYHVRDGYTRSAVEEARDTALGYRGIFAHFVLCQYDAVLPLGWALSRRAQADMDAQLGDGQIPRPVSRYHARQLERIFAFLRNPRADPAPELGTIARAERCGGG